MPGSITHFEIYGDNPGALADFYRAVLGWSVERADGVDYWRIHLDSADHCNTSGGVTYRPSIPVRGWLQ